MQGSTVQRVALAWRISFRMLAPNSAMLVGVMIACASVPALAGVVYSWAIFPKAPTA